MDDLLLYVARLAFEEDLTHQEIAEQLVKDGVLKAPNAKRVRRLFDEAGRALLREYQAYIRKETNKWGSLRDLVAKGNAAYPSHEAIEMLGLAVRTKYPHLKAVIMHPDAHPFWMNYDRSDHLMCGELREYFSKMVARSNDLQEELHLLVGAGQTILNVFAPPRGVDRSTPFVHCYPALITARTRMSESTPPSAEVNAIAAWLNTEYLSGRLHYTTISPPDLSYLLNDESSPADRHREACKLLREYTADLAKQKRISAMLRDMRHANAAIAGFGLLTPAMTRPPSPPRTTWVDRTGPVVEIPYSITYQSRTIFELLQPHGVSMEELVSEGAVGEFACCLFDAEGNGRKEWEFLLTAGYPNSVQHYKDMVKEGYPVIGVGNLATLPAIRAALQGKIVNILVTDIYAAAELDENGLHSEQQRKVMFHAATSDLAELINDVRHRPLSESEFLKRLEEGFVELRTWGPLAGWTSGILQEELDTWERELREAWTDGLKHPGRSTL